MRWLPDEAAVWVCAMISICLYGGLIFLDDFYPEIPEETELQIRRQKVVYAKVVLGDDKAESEGNHLPEGLLVGLEDRMVGHTIAEVKRESREQENVEKPNESAIELDELPAEAQLTYS